MRARATVGEQRSAPAPATAPARTLSRAIGNRATARLLARWTKHPDAEQKGMMVPDSVAEDFVRYNPPQNT